MQRQREKSISGSQVSSRRRRTGRTGRSSPADCVVLVDLRWCDVSSAHDLTGMCWPELLNCVGIRMARQRRS